jgi:multidrug efflux pump subunit AcrB
VFKAIKDSKYTSHIGDATISTNKKRQVLLSASTQSIEEIQQIILKHLNIAPIRIRDVATIQGPEDLASNQIKVNGKKVVFLSIYSEFASNNITVAKKIKDAIQTINQNKSNPCQLNILNDESELLKTRMLELLKRMLLTLCVLVLFVLGIYRKSRMVFYLSISLLINICISILGYLVFNISINLYSLAAVTVSFGFLIDNNIIVIDHFRRERKLSIVIPVIATVLTTLVALLPVTGLEKENQNLLYDFSLVLIINLAISIFISIFFLPALIYQNNWGVFSARSKSGLPKNFLLTFQKIYFQWISHVYKRKVLYFFLLLLLFGTPFYKLPQQINQNGLWSNIYNNSIGNSWVQKHIRPSLDVLLGGSLRLFDQYVFTGSYTEKAKNNELDISFQLSPNAPKKQLKRIAQEIEHVIKPHENHLQYITRTNPYQGTIKITFDQSKNFYSLASGLRSKIVRIANNLRGADWYIQGITKPYSNKDYIDMPHYAIAVFGYNYDNLLSLITQLSELISENKRIKNIKTVAYRDFSHSHKTINYYVGTFNKQFKYNHVSPAELNKFLAHRNQYSAFTYSWFKNGTTEKLIFRLNEIGDIWSINQGRFNSKHYGQNTLLQQTNLTKNNQSLHIIKKDQQYRLFIEFDYVGSYKYARIHIDSTLEKFYNIKPPGYFAKLQKNTLLIDQKDETNPWFIIFIALLLIFAITAILFNNLKQAFSILLFIPTSFIGVFIIFYVADVQFDAGGYAALFLTSGLSVNALCFILNEYNKLMKKRSSQSYLFLFTKAIVRKLLPVGLTIVSTIVGFIPFLINEPISFWFNFSIGTIGGLTISFLILILFPSVFLLNKKLH